MTARVRLGCLIAVNLGTIVMSAGSVWADAPPAKQLDAVVRPNIVFILADDLGPGDLGCYGQKHIRTPSVDRLAAEGMRFTQHYCGNAVCAPSRCVLMTGKHPGHAFVRDNREVQPEGQVPLPAGTVTLPALLKRLGYATGGFGKWGLGPPASSGDPLLQGFDRFFGYNCQRVAHNHYPASLWDNDRRLPLQNTPFAAHQKFPPGADATQAASYAPYVGKDFAPDVIAEQALQFIRAHRDRAFFLYFPSTIPHVALQAPADAFKQYQGRFDEQPYLGEQGYLPQRTPHAAYAAMVSRLDHHVGKLLALIQELKLDERTLFVFTSDNGPVYGRVGGADSEFFHSAGSARGRKGALYEGGIRAPLVVRWKGKIAAASLSDRVSGFEDWLPTLLELAGGKDGIPQEIDGISLAPTLLGQSQPPRPFLYREFPGYGGQQSVRLGNWKGVRQNLAPKGKVAAVVRTELYDLADDPGETRDVAAQHPNVVAEIERVMREQHVASKTFRLGAIDGK